MVASQRDRRWSAVRFLSVLSVAVGLIGSSPIAADADNPACTIVGTEGDDQLIGTSGDDVICGLGGNDTISGGSGNDLIYGGAGIDVISGGGGDDILHGGDGDDDLSGGSGNDEIWGDSGNDVLLGGSGNDVLRGGDGGDSASGGSGVDACEAETQVSCEEEASPPVDVTWSTSSVLLELSTGSSDSLQMTFAVDQDVEEAELIVTGEIADLVAILQPAQLYPLDAGVDYSAIVAVDVPTSTDLQTYTGQIQLVADGTTLVPSVDLSISVTAPSAEVTGFDSPSGDRIAPSDVGPEYVEGELLVALSASVADPEALIQELAADHGGVPVGGEGRLNLYQVRVPASSVEDLRSIRDAIAEDPDVSFATLHYLGDSLAATPNDPEWDSWDEADPSGNNWHLEYIHAPTGWDTTTGDPSVSIAIIDNEIDLQHEDLVDNAGSQNGFPVARGIGHGTRVAGVACAVGDNNLGVSGVAWDCNLNGIEWGFPVITEPDPDLPAIFFSPFSLTTRMLLAGDIGARVVNMSWGEPFGECAFSTAPPELVAEEMLGWNGPLGLAVAQASDDGHDVLWVAAAGNTECDARFISPAALSLVFDKFITVGGIEETGEIWQSGAGGSAFGDAVNVAAPATSILSTSPHHGFWFWASNYAADTGTSFAAPQVTGLAALMLDQNPTASASEIRACVIDGADEFGSPVAGHDFSVIHVPGALNCISESPTGNAVNLDFEMGDLTGWTIVESGDGGTQYQVVSPGLAGTDNAFHLASSGEPIDGIQQSIVWQYANCGVEAIATGGAGTIVRLQVLDASDGSTWGSHEYTFTGSEPGPVTLSVSGPTFYLPDLYTIQLLYVASSGVADVLFDEVRIQECT